jgi:hypothetical protein
MGGQPGKPKPIGNPPIRYEPQRPPIEQPPKPIPPPPVREATPTSARVTGVQNSKRRFCRPADVLGGHLTRRRASWSTCEKDGFLIPRL